MKIRNFLFPGIALSLIGSLFFPAAEASARPVSVILYPSGAMVTEEISCLPGEKHIRLPLPAGTDTASLSFQLSNGSVGERTLTRLHGEASPAISHLQQKAEALLRQKDALQAELSQLHAMREFWASSPHVHKDPAKGQRMPDLEDARRTAEAELASLTEKEVLLRAELRAKEREAAAMDARIKEMGQQNASQYACDLEVHNTGNSPFTLRWSYWLPDAGWEPQYRLEAFPDEGRVKIRMDASLRQNSGMDWNDVSITIATANRLNSVAPSPLRPWILGDTTASNSMLKAARPAVMETAVMGTGLPAVSQEETGLSWSFPGIDIPASLSVVHPLMEKNMEAHFRRLARPALSRHVWLCAELSAASLAERTIFPSGSALFFTNGQQTARGMFHLEASSREIFFGVDQLMSATWNESIEQDTAAEKNVRQWNWKGEISNAHAKSVDIRVEQAAPVLRDARIKVEEQSQPAARIDAERSCYVWDVTIPAGSRMELRRSIKVVFPEEKK